MFWIVVAVAAGILIGDLLRRARRRRELEDSFRREDQAFLDRLRGSR